MENNKLIKLNQWILDPTENLLIKEDNTKISLEAKYVLLLVFLAENPNTIISREQLMQAVWNNRCVEFRTINAAISRLRKILGGERDDFIKTHLKHGYSLTCQVEYIERGGLTPADSLIHKKKEKKQELTEKTPTDAYKSPHNRSKASSQMRNIDKQSSKALSTPFYRLYALMITVALVVVFALMMKPQETSQQILTEKDLSIEPLTYQKGMEIAPVLSADKSLIAYIHQSDHNSNYNVVVQNMATKQTITVEAEHNTYAPFWSAQSNQLFYMSRVNNSCLIKKIDVEQTLKISAPEIIIS